MLKVKISLLIYCNLLPVVEQKQRYMDHKITLLSYLIVYSNVSQTNAEDVKFDIIYYNLQAVV